MTFTYVKEVKKMKNAIADAERELARAEKHLARFDSGGKFEGKPEHFRKEAEEEVIICRGRLAKMISTNTYVARPKFTG